MRISESKLRGVIRGVLFEMYEDSYDIEGLMSDMRGEMSGELTQEEYDYLRSLLDDRVCDDLCEVGCEVGCEEMMVMIEKGVDVPGPMGDPRGYDKEMCECISLSTGASVIIPCEDWEKMGLVRDFA